MKTKLYIKESKFTLIELLVVISIMVIIAGIGVKGYKRMSGEMALKLSETQVRQVVTSTILEAKRNRIPMQIQVYVPDDINTKSSVISGGAGSLIAYWGFEGNTPKEGLRRLTFGNGFSAWGGYFGKGAMFNGGASSIGKKSPLLSFDNNVYMEVMLKPDIDDILSKTGNGTQIEVLNGGDGKFKLVLVNHEKFGLRVKAVVKNGGASIEAGIDRYFPDDGQWHKVAVSTVGGDDKLVSLYIDNVLIATEDGKADDVDGTGEENFTVGKSYYGVMDDIKVYNIGGGTQVSLNPRDTQILGLTKGKTHYINISPYGTINDDEIIQIASTRLVGRLKGASPNYTVERIRSSVPTLGFMSFEGKVAEYEWDGSEKVNIVEDGMFGTGNSGAGTFQVIKPIVIRRNGVVQ